MCYQLFHLFLHVNDINNIERGVVGTDGRKGETSVPAEFEKMYGDRLTLVSHSHGGGGGPPSVDLGNPPNLHGDLNSAMNSSYNHKREVYDVPGRMIYSYSRDTYGTWLNSGEKQSWDGKKKP